VSDAPATATRRKVPVRNVVGAVLGLAVLVGVFGFVLPRFADYGEVWRQLTAMSWWYLIALLVAEFLNIVTYAPNWMVALPGLRVRQALELQFMGTAVSNLAPLGGAVSIGFQMRVMRAWGFSTRAASRAMVVTGVWNNLLNVGLPVVALTSLSLSGGRNARPFGSGAGGYCDRVHSGIADFQY